jgi:L-fuconolactonase
MSSYKVQAQVPAQVQATERATEPPDTSSFAAWHASAQQEEALEPSLRILDPHHHLWDRSKTSWWPFKQKIYLLEDYMSDIHSSGHNVVGTVYVQAGSFYRRDGPNHLQQIGEVEFAQGVAARADAGLYQNFQGNVTRMCLGIQGTVDLRSHPQCEEALHEMMRCSRNFRGVRAAGPFDEDFKKGFRLLEQNQLIYDVWHSPKKEEPEAWIGELPKLTSLAKEFPNVTIVLNHLGGAVGPHLSEAAVKQWREALVDLAACSNVYCKVGGIQMVANGFQLETREVPVGSEELVELVFPWYEHAIKTFGTKRCMFESNFPADKDCVGYGVLWNTFKRIAARMNLSAEEKREIFYDTAFKVYMLKSEGDYAPRL